MDQNNYQPMYQQPNASQQPSAPQQPNVPQYSSPYYQAPKQGAVLPFELQQKINEIFSKALAAIIMSGFPVASIIGMIFGSKALKMVSEAIETCTLQGIALPGKLKTAKILATIAKWYGLASTIIWALFIAFYVLYFGLIILMAVLGAF